MSDLVETARMDKTLLHVVPMSDVPSDLEYWRKQSPQQRLAAIELLRAIHFGYDPATARLQRILEVAQFPEG